jgi:ABC-type transport system involved in multi-copper enzyme maturation permease subunit
MNSTWRSLLWKEWREQRWKLALMIAGCLAIGLVLAAVFGEWEAFIAGPVMMLSLVVPAVAVFIGAGIAAGERSHGTLPFLQALPSPMKKAAVTKLLVASATVAAPFFLASLVLVVTWLFRWPRFEIWTSDASFENDILPTCFGALVLAAASVSVLIWIAAAGVNHVDELRAGAIGLLTIAIVWALIAFVDYQYRTSESRPSPTWLRIASAGAPAGIADLINGSATSGGMAGAWRATWPLLAVYLPVHGMLSAWYIARLGRRAGPQRVAESLSQVQPAVSWLGAPRRTRVGAIVWKQLRESVPLAALGVLTILTVGPVVARASSTTASFDFFETWQLTALSVWLIAGIFISVVAGIGLFYDDLRPALHTFWRSRPIDVDAWFWTKLLTGLAITEGVLVTGPLLTLALLRYLGQPLASLPNEPSLLQIAGAGLLLHAFAFVLAALAIALVRQPVMAAMLTFGVGIAVAISIAAWSGDAPQIPLRAPVSLGLAGLAAASTLAWQAVRRDWGWGGTH